MLAVAERSFRAIDRGAYLTLSSEHCRGEPRYLEEAKTARDGIAAQQDRCAGTVFIGDAALEDISASSANYD
jgi:hypothetical protein